MTVLLTSKQYESLTASEKIFPANTNRNNGKLLVVNGKRLVVNGEFNRN
jgi:hypothetical protein